MAAERLHVKKGDRVLVLAGKDKGKEGKIISAEPKKGKVVVEGINKVKRHTKPSQTSQGGIVVKEAALAASNVMLVCPACKKASRIKKNQLSDGKNVRACVKCGENIDK